jgi:hypothetical protein
MAIAGTQQMFKKFPKRTLVTVNIGEPIYPHPEEGPLALTDRIMYAIAEMLPEELQGVYKELPQGFVR